MEAKVVKPVGPVEEIRDGDEFEWTCDVGCRSGNTVPKGSVAKVLGRTSEAPHGEVAASGHNLVVQTVHGISVWATFEQCLSRGLLKRAPEGPPVEAGSSDHDWRRDALLERAGVAPSNTWLCKRCGAVVQHRVPVPSELTATAVRFDVRHMTCGERVALSVMES